METPYDNYDVLDKWRSPSFDAVTRGVLTRRLHAVPERRVFSPDEFRLLEAICGRLIAQGDRSAPVPIAPFIDADLHDGKGEGFRQPTMPPPMEAWRQGLAGIEAEAMHRYVRPFADLPPDLQDATLKAVQSGEAHNPAFGNVPPKHFFDHVLLKSVVGVYYSHPAAWSEMGFGGPASPRGYVRTGLDARDPWEAPLAAPVGGAP